MSSTSSHDQQLIDAIMDSLRLVTDQVLLGYSATGRDDKLQLPALLLQLESLSELQQSGSRRKYQWQLNLSVVVPTDEQATITLLQLVRSVRLELSQFQRLQSQIRKLTFSEIQFDVAPIQGQYSFADMTLTLETVDL